MTKLRLKKKVKIVLILIVLFIVGIVIGINKYKDYKYKQTYEYKLITVGYTKEESNILIDKLTDKDIEYFINNEVNKDIFSILEEKYYMSKNLYRYLEYKELNKDKTYRDVISIVNVGADKEWYDEDSIKPTDVSKGNLILVNKFNYLNKDFVPENLTSISLNYAYSGHSAIKEVSDAYVDMAYQAKQDGISLIVNSSYRDYETQAEVYKEFYEYRGTSYADSYAAREGHSEHQTGLCLDIFTNGYTTTEDFEQSDAFRWLMENSYKYGFILRYPKGKEYLTGFNYESWHYRYLGKDVATKVYESGLTYDEYYAFYLS